MKRVFTLLLAAAMAFALCACGGGDTMIRDDEEDTAKKDPVAAQYLQELAVKLAEYPELPAMPNEAELDEAFSTIDYDKMGADAYEKRRRRSGRIGTRAATPIMTRSRRCAARGRATPRRFALYAGGGGRAALR